MPPLLIPNGAVPEAAMKIFDDITRTESLIRWCGIADPVNSYANIEKKYRKDTAPLITMIGIVVGNEARREGVERELFLETVERRVDSVSSATETAAEAEHSKHIDLCRALPEQAATQTGLFEPLDRKFPKEMKIIQNQITKE